MKFHCQRHGLLAGFGRSEADSDSWLGEAVKEDDGKPINRPSPQIDCVWRDGARQQNAPSGSESLHLPSGLSRNPGGTLLYSTRDGGEGCQEQSANEKNDNKILPAFDGLSSSRSLVRFSLVHGHGSANLILLDWAQDEVSLLERRNLEGLV